MFDFEKRLDSSSNFGRYWTWTEHNEHNLNFMLWVDYTFSIIGEYDKYFHKDKKANKTKCIDLR